MPWNVLARYVKADTFLESSCVYLYFSYKSVKFHPNHEDLNDKANRYFKWFQVFPTTSHHAKLDCYYLSTIISWFGFNFVQKIATVLNIVVKMMIEQF